MCLEKLELKSSKTVSSMSKNPRKIPEKKTYGRRGLGSSIQKTRKPYQSHMYPSKNGTTPIGGTGKMSSKRS